MMDFFRKRPLLGIILSLFFTLATLVAYSYSGFKLNLLGMEFRQPEIKEYISPPPPRAKLARKAVGPTLAGTQVPSSAATGSQPTVQGIVQTIRYSNDTSHQRILMIGESMIEGMYLRFLKYSKVNGFSVKAKIWYGSSLGMWCKGDTFKKILDQIKPTYVIVAIGSNELFIPHIRTRQVYLTKILDWLKDYKFVWIGPPNWKEDTGIGEMYKENIPDDQYFLSRNIKYNRRKDGAHPTQESCNMWADTVAKWIMYKSAYPIKLENPDDPKFAKAKPVKDPNLLAKKSTSATKAPKQPAKKPDSVKIARWKHKQDSIRAANKSNSSSSSKLTPQPLH